MTLMWTFADFICKYNACSLSRRSYLIIYNEIFKFVFVASKGILIYFRRSFISHLIPTTYPLFTWFPHAITLRTRYNEYGLLKTPLFWKHLSITNMFRILQFQLKVVQRVFYFIIIHRLSFIYFYFNFLFSLIRIFNL